MASVQPDHTAKTSTVALVSIFISYLVFFPTQLGFNLSLLGLLAPVWLSLLFGRFASLMYVKYRRMDNLFSQKNVLLELRIPEEGIYRAPAAMEAVFSSLNIGGGEGTWYTKYIKGGTRPQWSFEIVSFGGDVRFYVRTREAFRRGVEQFIIAQYPGIEIIESEDYSRLRNPSHEGFSMSAYEYDIKGDIGIPIKSHIDHNLSYVNAPSSAGTQNAVPAQIDPLAQMISIFTGLQSKEQLWIQFVVRQSKWEHFGKGTDYSLAKYIGEKVKEEKEEMKKQLYARKKSKPLFDVGIRAIYSVPTDAQKSGSVPGLLANIFNSFKDDRFSNIGLNGGEFSAKFTGDPWEDRKGEVKSHLMEEAVEAYRLRSFYHPPVRNEFCILNAEELATLYHIPFWRITDSKVNATPPLNLPR